MSPDPRTATSHRRAATAVDHATTVDTASPQPARRYDYWLGGKDNFAADRHSGDRIAEAFPTIAIAARENRRFLHRAVGFLADEVGIRQFIDIGCGIPAYPNVHDLAQAIDPTCRIVYVDNDPMVIAHTRALSVSHPDGATAHIHADLRDPDTILSDPTLTGVIDPTQPVAVLMVAVLHFLPDTDHPHRAVTHLMQAMTPGSHLVVSHATLDPLPPETRTHLLDLTAPDAGNGTLQPRSRDEITALLHGLTLTEPGLVPIVRWHPDQPPQPEASEQDTAMYGAVAKLP